MGLFCKHKWYTLRKGIKEIEEVSEGTKFWYAPIVNKVKITTEVFACIKCGKIKTIKY